VALFSCLPPSQVRTWVQIVPVRQILSACQWGCGFQRAGDLASRQDARRNPVEKQHVEVDIEVERTAEALDQRDRAGLGRLT